MNGIQETLLLRILSPVRFEKTGSIASIVGCMCMLLSSRANRFGQRRSRVFFSHSKAKSSGAKKELDWKNPASSLLSHRRWQKVLLHAAAKSRKEEKRRYSYGGG
jgi:hypothetical protein